MNSFETGFNDFINCLFIVLSIEMPHASLNPPNCAKLIPSLASLTGYPSLVLCPGLFGVVSWATAPLAQCSAVPGLQGNDAGCSSTLIFHALDQPCDLTDQLMKKSLASEILLSL